MNIHYLINQSFKIINQKLLLIFEGKKKLVRESVYNTFAVQLGTIRLSRLRLRGKIAKILIFLFENNRQKDLRVRGRYNFTYI